MECEFSNIIIVMLRHAELPVWQIVLNNAKTRVIWEGGTLYISFYQSHLVIISARLLVRAWVVNLIVVCSVVSFEDFVSQFQLLKQTNCASVDFLNVRYFFKKDSQELAA